jgi:hypothetical protein
MKQLSIFFTLLILSVGLFGCESDSPINTINFTNSSLASVAVNFRGELYQIPVGESVQLTEILDGEYEYETSFTIPSAGNGEFEAGEQLAGILDMKAGTTVLIYYVGAIDQDGKYLIDATVTSSNNLAEDGFLGNPVGP